MHAIPKQPGRGQCPPNSLKAGTPSSRSQPRRTAPPIQTWAGRRGRAGEGYREGHHRTRSGTCHDREALQPRRRSCPPPCRPLLSVRIGPQADRRRGSMVENSGPIISILIFLRVTEPRVCSHMHARTWSERGVAALDILTFHSPVSCRRSLSRRIRPHVCRWGSCLHDLKILTAVLDSSHVYKTKTAILL